MSDFLLTITTPAGQVFQGPATSLVAPGREGQFGILPYHAPFISALRRGVLKVETAARTRFFVVEEGVLEVSADNKVTLLGAGAEEAADQAEALAKLVRKK